MITSRVRPVQDIMDGAFLIPEQTKSLLIQMTGILIITIQMPNL